jgi:hypothetical protein
VLFRVKIRQVPKGKPLLTVQNGDIEKKIIAVGQDLHTEPGHYQSFVNELGAEKPLLFRRTQPNFSFDKCSKRKDIWVEQVTVAKEIPAPSDYRVTDF